MKIVKIKMEMAKVVIEEMKLVKMKTQMADITVMKMRIMEIKKIGKIPGDVSIVIVVLEEDMR